jgi:hypothetical protein
MGLTFQVLETLDRLARSIRSKLREGSYVPELWHLTAIGRLVQSDQKTTPEEFVKRRIGIDGPTFSTIRTL